MPPVKARRKWGPWSTGVVVLHHSRGPVTFEGRVRLRLEAQGGDWKAVDYEAEGPTLVLQPRFADIETIQVRPKAKS